MAVNEELSAAVMHAIARALLKEDDTTFKAVCNDDEEQGVSVVEYAGQTMVDTPHKVRHHFSSVIGYGYDFAQNDEDGAPAKETYERAVNATRARLFGDNGETLLSDEVVDDRFGLYVTSIP